MEVVWFVFIGIYRPADYKIICNILYLWQDLELTSSDEQNVFVRQINVEYLCRKVHFLKFSHFFLFPSYYQPFKVNKKDTAVWGMNLTAMFSFDGLDYLDHFIFCL